MVTKDSSAKWDEGLDDSQLWTIHGRQYDLRSFVSAHPGGERAILLGQGRDCTELFESYHPLTNRHRAVLLKYAARSRPVEVVSLFEWEKTPFYDEAKEVVLKHFSPSGNTTEAQQKMKATSAAWTQHGIGLVLTLLAFWRWCSGDIAAIYYFPFIYWLACSDMMHNGSHFAQSKNPIVNTFCTYLGSLHVNYHLWALQHVVGHHSHTNVLGKDPDLAHFSHEKPEEKSIPGYRSHREQEYLPKYRRFWKFAMFFQAFATTLALAVLNIPMYIADKAMVTVSIPKDWVGRIVADRLVVLAGVMAVLYCHGLGRGLWMVLHSWGIHGILFYIFSQVSHTNEHCMDGLEAFKKARNTDRIEWAAHQMLTATDYSCDSKLWCTLSIHLNSQMIHHVFPSMHPCHYPAVRRLLLPVAAKHGIDYEGRSSYDFVTIFKLFVTWIWGLNEKPKADYKPLIGNVSESNLWSGVASTAMMSLYVSPLVGPLILNLFI